jgi:hypothetical protein
MIEKVKITLAAVIVGILVAPLALVVVGIAKTAGVPLSVVQGIAASGGTPTHRTTEVSSAEEAQVVKMPERGREDEEFRSAA